MQLDMRLAKRAGEVVDLLGEAGLAARRLRGARAVLQAVAAARDELLTATCRSTSG